MPFLPVYMTIFIKSSWLVILQIILVSTKIKIEGQLYLWMGRKLVRDNIYKVGTGKPKPGYMRLILVRLLTCRKSLIFFM